MGIIITRTRIPVLYDNNYIGLDGSLQAHTAWVYAALSVTGLCTCLHGPSLLYSLVYNHVSLIHYDGTQDSARM